MTRRADVDAAVAVALERFGRLDMVVANAGFGVVGTSRSSRSRTTAASSRRTCSRVLGPSKRLAGADKTRGRVVLIGSVAGYVAAPNARRTR